MMEYPKLRWPIELKFDKVGEHEVLVVRCPLGITAQPLLLVPAAAPLLSCFDGKTSIAEISAKYAQYGIRREIVEELARIVDAALFLDNERFHEAERRWRAEYDRLTVRQAALAGPSYPARGADLTHEIDGYLSLGRNGTDGTNLACLVSPHIDYRRGGPCYGMTYRRLAGRRYDLYVIIGVAHMYSPYLFHLSRKDFAGPLGTLTCARDFVARLGRRYGEERAFADEILHRNEHSVELQLPFLTRLQPDAAIVPILTGGFHKMLTAGAAPQTAPEYDDFAGALAEGLRQEIAAGKRVCLLAAVDMAHIGRSFGDTSELSAAWMEEIERRDRRYLEALLAHDKEQLFAHVAEDGDSRRICGFPAVYLTLDVLQRAGIPCRGELVDYRQAVDYESQCAVTFAGAALYAR